MSSKAFSTVLLPDPESPVRMTSWLASLFLGVFTCAHSRSGFHPTLMSAGDAHVFAVFGDGASRYVDAGVFQPGRDVLVGKRLGGILLFDHLFHQPLQRQQRHPAALRSVYRLAEE